MTYLVRLRPHAEAPASAEYTIGKVHILEPWHEHTDGSRRYAYAGAPTRCGKVLDVVAQLGTPFDGGSDRRAVLHFAERIEPDQSGNLCSGCFGPHPVARWAA